MPLIDDRFANVITAEVTQTAANAEAFQEIATGVSLGQQLGMVIDELEFFTDLSTLITALAGDGDRIDFAITTSDLVDDFDDVTDRRILWSGGLVKDELTSGVVMHKNPIGYRTFNPPLIHASPRIFLGVDSSSLAIVLTIRCRIHFRYIKLTAQEYLEVAETFLITS